MRRLGGCKDFLVKQDGLKRTVMNVYKSYWFNQQALVHFCFVVLIDRFMLFSYVREKKAKKQREKGKNKEEK